MHVDTARYFDASDADRRGTVERCAVPDLVSRAHWLVDDLLLLVSRLGTETEATPKATLTLREKSLALDVRSIALPSPDYERNRSDTYQLLQVRFPPCEHGKRRFGKLRLQADELVIALDLSDLAPVTIDLQTLAREHLTGLEPESRTELLEFLGTILTDCNGARERLRLSKCLHTLREAVRERLPYCVIAQDVPRGLHVDTILSADERFFYIRGWMRDEHAKIDRLVAVSPEGQRTPILDRAFNFPRPDVEAFYSATDVTAVAVSTGFISAVETAIPSYLSNGWLLEMHDTDGVASEAAAPAVARDPIAVRDALLVDLAHERLPRQSLRANHIHPALERLQERIRDLVTIESVDDYGTLPESPDVSILVPLYQRIDFLEHQLAQFVHDPGIQQVELIYILDSPELASELAERAAQLFRLYRTPFRVVTLQTNAGFALANNAGASLAHGRRLLLLNSDVLPVRPGWLKTMVGFYDSRPNIGALGPKLLYEDGSLQHAGMYFLRPPGVHVWQNQHYFKGLHRSLPAANVPRAMPAVTGACLMIDRNLYRELGGLRGGYIQGDFEDSDICLRLLEAGYENWYLPDVELYHLEGQSYPGPLRQLTHQYNSWLHTHYWNELIQEVMSRHTPPGAAQPLVSR